MRRSAAIVQLERQIEQIESKPRGPGGSVPTGVSSLDTLLPGGGLPRGQVVEWLGPRSSGKTTLLRATFATLRATGESIALIDPARSLYAPDWTSLIVGEGRFWVIRPPDPTEAVWCADLILRSGAFGAVALLASTHTVAADGVDPLLRRAVTIRLQRLAEEANAVFLTVGHVPLAALRLSFRAGRVESVQKAFGPFLSSVRPIWVRVGKRGAVEVPLLCPVFPSWGPEPARDRKGPAT
jgi:RecA/RadA recombinase